MIALDGFGRQLLVNVLDEEFFHEDCKRFRDLGDHSSAGLRHLTLLLFLDAAMRFGILSFRFGGEPGIAGAIAVLSS